METDTLYPTDRYKHIVLITKNQINKNLPSRKEKVDTNIRQQCHMSGPDSNVQTALVVIIGVIIINQVI